ncbi:MAG TPA: tetratricopeptide repeat protein, partial [Candidatus Sulfotelmatobacter sp.]|nr:tetratricopeptide repeat protein [Candidatus Sulfotelmatobacter sp.]
DLLRLDPHLIAAHVILGRAYLAKGDYQRAAVEAEGVVALEKNSTDAYLLLGETYGKLDLLKKAAQALHTAIVLEPYNVQVHAKFRAAKMTEIDADLAGLLAKAQTDQWNAPLHFDLAKLYLEKGEREPAVRELQLAQRDPLRAPLAFNLLGNIFRSDGRYDLAAAQYNRALEAAPESLARTIRLNLGTTYEATGDVRRAIKIYESIMQEEIDFGNLQNRVKLLKTTSLQNMRNRPLLAVSGEPGGKEVIALWGREGRAGTRPGRKEEVDISFGHEHNQAAFEYFMKGMYSAAEEEFSLAVQLDRNFATALNNLGVTLARQGKAEAARPRLSEATQLDPSSPVFYNNLGVCYLLLGKSDLARVALEKSYALDPEAAGTCLNLGDVYYGQKEARKAIELYRKVGAFDPLTDLAERRLFCKVPATGAA